MLDTPEEDGSRYWSFGALTPDPRLILAPEHLEAIELLYVPDAAAASAGYTDQTERLPYTALREFALAF